eukprot:449564_1
MSTAHNDRKALLTSNIPNTRQSIAKPTKHYKNVAIIFGICLIAGITAIFLFVIYDVFDLNSSSKSPSNPGMIGLWPTYGGSLQNQQKPPHSTDVTINTNNIKNLKIQCIYESPDGIGSTGYPTIDDNLNAYFTDMNGYITSVNLDSCQLIWRSHIGTLLGYDETMKVITMNSVTLFQDSTAHKGVLFTAPTRRFPGEGSTYPNNMGCYVIAVHLNNGSLWWKTAIGEDNDIYSYKCSSHGFVVDGKYAYGGMSQSSQYDAEDGSKFIGKYSKIDIDSHEMVAEWYPFNINLTQYDKFNKSYGGIGIYNFPAIIDQYLVFGTGNLHRTPKNIDDCLTYGQQVNISQDIFNNYLQLNKSHYIDLCGNDASSNRFWRCLENHVYVDSIII